MSTTKIPLAEPDLSGNEKRYLIECVDSGFVSSVGPFVARFEGMVAEVSGATHAVATSSGTSALHLALTGVGVTRDDLVALPSFTFIASANAIAHCGATPLLCDVERSGWTLDAPQLAEALREECRFEGQRLVHRPTGRRVAAILPVYTLGNPADAAAIGELGARYRLPIVADAAAALGAGYRGGPIGRLADVTVYSFNGNKTVTSGGGGMVVGESEPLMKRLRHLATTARVGTDYHHDEVGFNYRMTNLQAAVGCAQIERLDRLLAAKRHIRSFYDRELARPGLAPFPSPSWGESACWFSGFTIEDERLPQVSALCSALRASAIEARPFWKPVHLQPPYRDAPRLPLPNAEERWSRVLTLPCSTALTDGDLTRVVDAVRAALVQV